MSLCKILSAFLQKCILSWMRFTWTDVAADPWIDYESDWSCRESSWKERSSMFRASIIVCSMLSLTVRIKVVRFWCLPFWIMSLRDISSLLRSLSITRAGELAELIIFFTVVPLLPVERND